MGASEVAMASKKRAVRVKRKPRPSPATPPAPAPATAIDNDDEAIEPDQLFSALDPKGSHFYLGEPVQFEDIYSLLMPAGERGANQTVSAKLPNELCQAMDLIVAGRRTPFQSRTDMLRSGTFMLLRTLALADNGPKVFRDAIKVINLGVMRAQLNQRKRDMQRYLEETEELLRSLISDGNRREAVKLLARAGREIATLDDPYWKKMGEEWIETARKMVERRGGGGR